MTRNEREQLIERWARGEMTPSEEQNFFIEVAANRELRSELKAYRIVDEALRKDDAAYTSTYTSLRAGMLAMIAAEGALGGGSSAGKGHSDRATSKLPAEGAPVSGDRSSSVLWKSVAAGLAMAVVVMVFLFSSADRNRSAMPEPAVVPHLEQWTRPAAPRPIDTLPTPIDAAPSAARKSDGEPAAAAVERPRRVAPRRDHAESFDRIGTSQGSDAMEPATESVETKQERARRDSLKIKLMIQPPKKNQ